MSQFTIQSDKNIYIWGCLKDGKILQKVPTHYKREITQMALFQEATSMQRMQEIVSADEV